MLEPLIIDPPFPSTPVTVALGSTVALALGSMILIALLVMPAMRLSALVTAAARWLVHALPRLLLRRRAVDGELPRPLNLGGVSQPLARVIRQTRTLALELRRCSAEAAEWPAESAAPEPPRAGWRESLLGGTDGRAPLTAIRSEVFAWLGLVETLPPGDREVLSGVGVDVAAVRKALTDDCAPAEVVRALAGLLWSIDERLAAASTFGYRGTEAASVGTGAGRAAGADADADEGDERARRRRWAGTLAEHGRGLSRMAASYTRGAAEREDLEQDIALALWRALPTFRGESSLKTFAYRVARYCCFRHVRRRKDTEAAVDPGGIADPSACIESAILRADQRARIEQALTDLPDNLESVLTLHLTGHSYAQIAETLGITERNVSVRLSRARARLRRQLVAA
jgi:RNA polymerase sigma factor (sigma-70 family)